MAAEQEDALSASYDILIFTVANCGCLVLAELAVLFARARRGAVYLNEFAMVRAPARQQPSALKLRARCTPCRTCRSRKRQSSILFLPQTWFTNPSVDS